jgi:hypothetical protein
MPGPTGQLRPEEIKLIYFWLDEFRHLLNMAGLIWVQPFKPIWFNVNFKAVCLYGWWKDPEYQFD